MQRRIIPEREKWIPCRFLGKKNIILPGEISYGANFKALKAKKIISPLRNVQLLAFWRHQGPGENLGLPCTFIFSSMYET